MSKVKFGIYVGAPGPSPDKVVQRAVWAEENGFDSFWLADHVLSFSETCPDAWAVLAAIAMVTKRIKLATGVTDPFRRHPLVAAQTSATIDQLSNGRFMFGIGPGEAMNLLPMGMTNEKSVARMVAYIKAVQELLSGKKIDRLGSFFVLNNAYLQVKPVQQRLPVYIAGNGPTTRRITGELGDGWFPILETPLLYQKHLDEVEKGCQASGRKLDDIDTCLFMMTAVSEDSVAAIDQAAKSKMILASFPKKIEEEYGIAIDDAFSWKDKPVSEMKAEKSDFISKQIPDRAVTDFNIVGNVEECIKKLEAFVKVGVRHFSLLNLGPSSKEVYSIYGDKIIPYFKENYKD